MCVYLYLFDSRSICNSIYYQDKYMFNFVLDQSQISYSSTTLRLRNCLVNLEHFVPQANTRDNRRVVLI